MLLFRSTYNTQQELSLVKSFVTDSFLKSGWDVDFANNANAQDLELIGLSENDVPSFLKNEGDDMDFVYSDGRLALPKSKIPFSMPSFTVERPLSKTVTYMSRRFKVTYFHSGDASSVKEIN